MSGMPEKKNQLRSHEAPEPDNDENSAPASLPDHNLLPDYDDDRGHKQPSRILRDIVLDIRFQIVAGTGLQFFGDRSHDELVASNPLYARLAALQFTDGQPSSA